MRNYYWTIAILLFSMLGHSQGLLSGKTIDGENSALAKFENIETLGIMTSVKFSIFLDKNQKPDTIVFQNSNTFPFHRDFLTTLKEFKGLKSSDIDKISQKNNADRKLYLGTLFQHFTFTGSESSTFYSYEIVSQDLVATDSIKQIHALLVKSSPETFKDVFVKYMASGERRTEILSQSEDLKKSGIIIYDIFENRNFYTYSAGWSVGIIRNLKADEIEKNIETLALNADSIIVTDRVPREIPALSGVLSQTPTAPSSHVSLLANMYQIPFAFDKEIAKKTIPLEQKKVFLSVGAQNDLIIKEISNSTYDRLKNARNPKPLAIKLNKINSKIVSTKTLQESDLSAYGGKAVRLGLIQRSIPNNSPEYAVGIPHFYFRKYIETTQAKDENMSLAEFISLKIKSIKDQSLDFSKSAEVLKSIRTKMKETIIPEGLRLEIQNQLLQQIPDQFNRVKLRSSSNVEDGSEFSGAGLYDSEGVWLRNPPVGKENDFQTGLNKVWRSLYSDRGFFARQKFSVDESMVSMAVLAQIPYVGELANGVALLYPPPDEFNPVRIELTSFPGEEDTVANPTSQETPEIAELILVDQQSNIDDNQWNTSIKQKTSLLPTSRTVLSESDYPDLAKLLQKVVEKWPNSSLIKSGFDFEWKLIQADSKQKLVVKQVRPISVSQKPKLEDNSNYFFLGEEQIKYEIGVPESSDAFGLHFCPLNLAVTWPSFSQNDLGTSIVIPKLQFSHFGQNYDLNNVNAKVKFLDSERKKVAIEILVDTEYAKNISLNFSNEYFQDEFLLNLSGSSRLPISESEKTKTFFPNVKDYSCAYYTDNYVYGTSFPDYKFSGLITLKEGQIKVAGNYKLKTGVDKTFFFEIQSAEVSGFGLKTPISFSVPQSVVYAPVHHNFDWALSFDFKYANADVIEKEKFIKKFGRYFFYKFGDKKGAWLSEKGVLSKPFPAKFTSTK